MVQDTYTAVLIAGLFTTLKLCNQPRHPAAEGWIEKTDVVSQAMEFYQP